MRNLLRATAFLALGLGASPLLAMPVNGTGLVTNNVIFGTGNDNGSFTGDTGGSVEVALRGKLRYDINGDPQNIFNYDGVRTYTFDPASSNAPADRSIFNLEFSINSDPGGGLNRNVNDLVYVLTVDVDPGPGVLNGISIDPIDMPFADHSFGNNGTAQSAGVEAIDAADYQQLRISNNLVQNSTNLGFLGGLFPDPQAPGTYTFSLSASNSLGVLAETSIDILVLAQVPAPAVLVLLAPALLLVRLRRAQRLT